MNYVKLIRNLFMGIFSLLFLLVIIIACGVPTYASKDSFVFEHITSADGLSHDTVYSIAQDISGYMWFGTEDGLNKYDGYDIEVYRGGHLSGAIGNANCAVLFVDDTNSIWIASWGGGVEVLDQQNGNVTTYLSDPADPGSISDNSVHSIYKDSRGTLWFGTYTNGLNRFDSDTGKFDAYTHSDSDSNSISDNRVWWISEDSDGSLLLATNKGLDKFDPETETFTHYSQIVNRVRTMYWDKNNTLWLGTQNGLCRFDTKTGEYKYYMQNIDSALADVITSIYEDSAGNFWVGSSDGLNLFDRNSGLFTRYTHDPYDDRSISNNDIRVIFEDRSANLWIGTRGGGVNKVDIKPDKFQSYNGVPNSKITLSNINVSSIFQSSDGVIWVGTNNGGLNKFDLVNHTQEYLLADITKESNRDIIGICEDTDSIWVGSLGGLNRIDKLTGAVITYTNVPEKQGSLSDNTVLSVLKDSKGIIWIGTLSGLNKYDSVNDQFISYLNDSENTSSISADTVNCLYEDSSNRLWIGTQNGLNLFDRETGKFTRFVYDKDSSTAISDNIIHCIFEDSAQNLWIGTQYGLNCLVRDTNSFVSYTSEDGLPNNCIRGIQEDTSGKLWISTNKGISCFDILSSVFTNYDIFDGLQGNGYNNNACETTRYGELLFGGTQGLDFINPDSVAKNTFVPAVVITKLLIMDEEYDFQKVVEGNGKISLTYEDKYIHVEFASLDFTNSIRNQYAYMLEGFDKDWIYIGTRNSFDYTNMPSGDYVLRIKGTNSDGIWNEVGVSLKISVLPPWWLSPIAYFVYSIVFILIMYSIIIYITKKKEKRTIALTKMLEKTISVMSRIGEMRDVYTAAHQRRVQQLSCAIAREMGLSEDTINNIYLGSLIHDIGKINIASEFLNRPGKLTNLEFKILQSHVMHGYEIIKGIGFPPQVTAIVCQHHERLDGSGYPDGISGDQIITESRIVAVADVVEAMSSNRPYRPALGIDAALEEITKYRGVKFDDKVVDACVKLFKEKGFAFDD